MRLFSRNKEAVEAVPADDVPFQALRRSPRNVRKTRSQAGPRMDDPAAPLDPAQASRTRARRRLIGAIALALAAIVFVPMLFDRAAVPPADDIGLQIPDRDTPFEGRRGVPDAARTPLKPSADLPAVASTTTPVVEAPPPQADAPTPPEKSLETAPARPPVNPPARTTERTTEKPADKAPAAAAPADDPRALAALEGKADAATPSDAGASRNYAVQIAAFSAADKAKGLRDQLVANGLKSYTESVSTAQGLRVRVRLGPFASREAADRAKQKLKTMKLDGSVVPL